MCVRTRPITLALCLLALAPRPLFAEPVYPDSGSPVPACHGRLAPGAAGVAEHTLRLPAGRWTVRLRSGAFQPVLEVVSPGGVVDSASYEPVRGDGVSLVVESATAGDYHLRVSGARGDDAGDYLLSVNPVGAVTAPMPVATLDVELSPALTYPLADGEHSASPVCLTLEGGRRYRLTSRCENGKTWLLMPAQHGLERRLSTLSIKGEGEDACLDFVAPRPGLYVFWCVTDALDFRTRATVAAVAYPLDAGLPVPSVGAFITRPTARQLTIWKRHGFALAAGEGEVAVPCPSRATLTVELTARDGEAAYEVVAGAKVVTLRAPAGVTASERVVLPEGAAGVRLRGVGPNADPALLAITTEAPREAGALAAGRHGTAYALPAVLRAKVKSGDRLSVAVRGAGCSPQLVLRGAGILAACTDPAGRSPLAAVDGVATRDGIVEVLVASGGAEPGAYAACAFQGFDPRPDGRGPELDLPELSVLSSPGVVVLSRRGALTETSPKLADGSRVAWHRVPVKAGRTYRVLADAVFAPDLVLDVPGAGKRLAPCGIALLRPAADGEATLGLAAPGANIAGDFSLAVCDITDTSGAPSMKAASPAPESKPATR